MGRMTISKDSTAPKILELYVPGPDELRFREEMLSDPETMSYNANWDIDSCGYHKETGCIDFPKSEWDAWYKDWIGNEPESFYAYIRRVSDGAFIGDVNFHYTPEKEWWDMGIVICAPYRGRGYAVPALRLMLSHAFRDCGVTRLHNDFEITRSAALNVHLAAGFRITDDRDGIVHVMLTKEEFLRGCEGDDDRK